MGPAGQKRRLSGTEGTKGLKIAPEKEQGRREKETLRHQLQTGKVILEKEIQKDPSRFITPVDTIRGTQPSPRYERERPGNLKKPGGCSRKFPYISARMKKKK